MLRVVDGRAQLSCLRLPTQDGLLQPLVSSVRGVELLLEVRRAPLQRLALRRRELDRRALLALALRLRERGDGARDTAVGARYTAVGAEDRSEWRVTRRVARRMHRS